MAKNNKQQIKELQESVGLLAEMSLLYMRASIEAGASIEEAARLTQAYISAMIFGRRQEGGNHEN